MFREPIFLSEKEKRKSVMNRKKPILLIIFSMIFVAGLSACGKENKQVFSVNGETLSYREVAAFGLVYTKERNIVDKEMLEKQYEGKQTYGDYYMNQFEEDIVETLLLAKVAKDEKIKLSDEEKQQVKDNAASIEKECGEAFLEGLEVKTADLEKIYELKFLADSYMRNISKGEDADGGADESDEQQIENSEQDRYIKVFQVTFRTAEVDENGLVKTDQDGNIIKVEPSEVAKKKQEADEFVEKLQAGEDMEALLKNYDSRVTGMEQYFKYNDLAPEYKKAVDNLKEGQTSGVISSIYGYYIIKLLDEDASDLSETLSQHADRVEEQGRTNAELERLYSMYIGNDTDYKEQELWDSFQIQQFVK